MSKRLLLGVLTVLNLDCAEGCTNSEFIELYTWRDFCGL